MINKGAKPLSASSKTVKKTEKKLLHFGLDYLTINTCHKFFPKTNLEKYFESIFNIPHNFENTNTVKDFVWGNSDLSLRIIFSEAKEGEIAQFHWKEEYLFQICKIDPEYGKWKNIRYKYKYRLQFYGDFFNAIRRDEIDLVDILDIFILDGDKCSLSRFDLCADISGITPKEIYDGINGSRLRDFCEFKKNKKTGKMETFYYGDKNNCSTWYTRVYDKIADSRTKKKEKMYSEYFQYENVTRIELEIHTDTIKEWMVDLLNIQNTNFLWTIFHNLLRNKYNDWAIIPFLKRELKKHGFKKIPVERMKINSQMLAEEAFAKRFESSGYNFISRYDKNPIIFLLKSHIHLSQDDIDETRYLLDKREEVIQKKDLFP
jgi:hypothetical protein